MSIALRCRVEYPIPNARMVRAARSVLASSFEALPETLSHRSKHIAPALSRKIFNRYVSFVPYRVGWTHFSCERNGSGKSPIGYREAAGDPAEDPLRGRMEPPVPDAGRRRASLQAPGITGDSGRDRRLGSA